MAILSGLDEITGQERPVRATAAGEALTSDAGATAALQVLGEIRDLLRILVLVAAEGLNVDADAYIEDTTTTGST